MTELLASQRQFDLGCIGRPGPFEREDTAGYDNLLARVCGTAQRRVRTNLGRDIADFAWEITARSHGRDQRSAICSDGGID